MQLFAFDLPSDFFPSSDCEKKMYQSLHEVDKKILGTKFNQYLLRLCVNARQELQIQHLENLCYTDDLTQLRNQRYFNLCLNNLWEESAVRQAPLSMILMDIDNLKIYNLMRGNKMGDEYVYKIANQISKCVDKNGLVTRYQDDSFAILLPDTTTSQAVEISETIREEVQNLGIKHAIAKVGGLQFPVVTISSGVVCMVPKLEKSSDSLVDIAFRALHRAKKMGGNTTYTPTQN